MQVDFGRTTEDYARHRAGFPDELFERLARRGIGHAGQCRHLITRGRNFTLYIK